MNCNVISEIGINHKGDMDVAKSLINASKDAGCWGVKFQYRYLSSFYNSTNEIGDEILSEEMKRINLEPEQYEELRRYAQDLGLAVGISFFRAADMKKYGANVEKFDFFKIPSAEMRNEELFEALKPFDKLIIISTGGHTEREVLETILRLDAPNMVFLHCVANYPVLAGNQNLAFIKKIAAVATQSSIGYSSHDENWEVALLSLAMGAEYIERHITLDKQGGGLDDSTSSTPHEFKSLCLIANQYSAIIGDGRRTPNQGEIINMQNLGTSLYATKDLAGQTIVSEADFVLKAPRKGLTRAGLEEFIGKPLSKSIKEGEPVTSNHFRNSAYRVSQDIINFADQRDISIPVRLHDFKGLTNRIPVKNRELHVSYGEVARIYSNLDILEELDVNGCQYSIHLPDYLAGNRLIDPISPNAKIREDSEELIKQVKHISKILVEKTGQPVPIVGSFSRKNAASKKESLDLIFNYIDSVSDEDFKILPQWLPKIAWYFGGAEKLELFCDPQDVEYIEEHRASICLDVSHLILSANYARENWWDWYKRLDQFAEHIHLADGTGVDGEGVSFGEGDLRNIPEILGHPRRIVLETWQGHMYDGQGFIDSLHYLRDNYG